MIINNTHNNFKKKEAKVGITKHFMLWLWRESSEHPELCSGLKGESTCYHTGTKLLQFLSLFDAQTSSTSSSVISCGFSDWRVQTISLFCVNILQ